MKRLLPLLTCLLLLGCGPDEPHYASCADVQAAGKAPLHSADPGYRSALDRDGDGVACDTEAP